MELTKVMSGEHPPPSCSEDIEAYLRYWNYTRRWINSLSAADCESLINDMEARKLSWCLRVRIFERYGELLGREAITRKGVTSEHLKAGDTLATRTIVSEKGGETCNMIAGWARRDPESAWRFYRSMDSSDTQNHLGDGSGDAQSMFQMVFEAWAERDPDTAFSYVMKCQHEEYEQASEGYFLGLKGPAFASEAAKLDRLISYKRNLGELTWSRNDETAEYALGIALALRWVDQDPAAAFGWWMSRDDDKHDADRDANRKGYWTGLLFEMWSNPGAWEDPSPPKRAAQWLENNTRLLSEESFRDVALPAVARKSPDTAIRLIRGLDDPQKMAYYLAQLACKPTFIGEDRYRRMVPSALLDPDIVENELSQYDFNSDQMNLVMNAITERRKYEAEKPTFPDCGW